MSSRFWWKIRRIWHGPQMWVDGLQPYTFWSKGDITKTWDFRWNVLGAYYNGKRNGNLCKSFYIVFKQHLKGSLIVIKRKLLYLQPLRCNGNKGGWRTVFCDWLENKARAAEEREYYKNKKEKK
jgi:hypothetical protein